MHAYKTQGLYYEKHTAKMSCVSESRTAKRQASEEQPMKPSPNPSTVVAFPRRHMTQKMTKSGQVAASAAAAIAGATAKLHNEANTITTRSRSC